MNPQPTRGGAGAPVAATAVSRSCSLPGPIPDEGCAVTAPALGSTTSAIALSSRRHGARQTHGGAEHVDSGWYEAICPEPPGGDLDADDFAAAPGACGVLRSRDLRWDEQSQGNLRRPGLRCRARQTSDAAEPRG